MTDFHDLQDDLPSGDYERIGDALRSDLRASAVPHDHARADAMIRVATEARTGRFTRWAAPVGTAAAILAVGAGVAVFAATGGTDNAAPPAGGGGGHHHAGQGPVGPYNSVLCVSFDRGHPPATGVVSMPAITEVAPAGSSGAIRLRLPPVTRPVKRSTATLAPTRALRHLPVATPTEMPAPGRVTCSDGHGRSVGCGVVRAIPSRIGVLPKGRPVAIGCPPVGGILGRVGGAPASTYPVPSLSAPPSMSATASTTAAASTSPGRMHGSESPPKPADAASCSAPAGAVVSCVGTAVVSAPPSQTK